MVLPCASKLRSMTLIIPIKRKEPFDDLAYLFELKLDGFRGLADTIAGRMLSSYRRILVTEGVRRQRLELAI